MFFLKGACAVNETWRGVLRFCGNRKDGAREDYRCACVWKREYLIMYCVSWVFWTHSPGEVLYLHLCQTKSNAMLKLFGDATCIHMLQSNLHVYWAWVNLLKSGILMIRPKDPSPHLGAVYLQVPQHLWSAWAMLPVPLNTILHDNIIVRTQLILD